MAQRQINVYSIRDKTTGRLVQVAGNTLADALYIMGWAKPNVEVVKTSKLNLQHKRQKWG